MSSEFFFFLSFICTKQQTSRFIAMKYTCIKHGALRPSNKSKRHSPLAHTCNNNIDGRATATRGVIIRFILFLYRNRESVGIIYVHFYVFLYYYCNLFFLFYIHSNDIIVTVPPTACGRCTFGLRVGLRSMFSRHRRRTWVHGRLYWTASVSRTTHRYYNFKKCTH